MAINGEYKEAIEIKWAHQDRVQVALVWLGDRALFELESNPLNERFRALLNEICAQQSTIISFDAWPLVNELRKRHAVLSDGIDLEGNRHPALREIHTQTRNVTTIKYFDGDKLQDPSEFEPAVQLYEPNTGALMKAKSYKNNVFNYELNNEQLYQVAQSKGVMIKPQPQMPETLSQFRVALKQA